MSRKSPAICTVGTEAYTISPPTRQTSSEPPVELPPYPATKRPHPRKKKTAAIISSREGHGLNGPMVLRVTSGSNKALLLLLGGFDETGGDAPEWRGRRVHLCADCGIGKKSSSARSSRLA